MQVPVLGCTFLTLSDREESTAENRQLSERGSAPIGTGSCASQGARTGDLRDRCVLQTQLITCDDQCPDDRCPAVPPASSAHLCPAVRPLAPPTCAQQITHLCPAV
ncbi:unnamed protein product, partial [Staurois parvus]